MIIKINKNKSIFAVCLSVLILIAEIIGLIYIAAKTEVFSTQSPFVVFIGVLSGIFVTSTARLIYTSAQTYLKSPERKIRLDSDLIRLRYMVLNSELKRQKGELENRLNAKQNDDGGINSKKEGSGNEIQLRDIIRDHIHEIEEKEDYNNRQLYHELEFNVRKYHHEFDTD